MGNCDFGPRESWRVLVGPRRSGFPAAPLGPTGSYQELDELGLGPTRSWISVELGRVGSSWGTLKPCRLRRLGVDFTFEYL